MSDLSEELREMAESWLATYIFDIPHRDIAYAQAVASLADLLGEAISRNTASELLRLRPLARRAELLEKAARMAIDDLRGAVQDGRMRAAIDALELALEDK